MAENKKNGMKVFRTALGGFNKADVNNYLISLNNEYKEKEAALRERAERAEKEAREISDGSVKEKLEARIAELEGALAGRGDVSLPEDYEELRKKAQLYEETTAKIGEAIVSAKKTAEEIIAKANADADSIREKAEQDADERRREVEANADKAFATVFAKLKETADKSCAELEENSTSVEEKLRRAMMDIRMESASVSEKIAWNESSLRAEINAEISRITAKSEAK